MYKKVARLLEHSWIGRDRAGEVPLSLLYSWRKCLFYSGRNLPLSQTVAGTTNAVLYTTVGLLLLSKSTVLIFKLLLHRLIGVIIYSLWFEICSL